MKDAPCLNCEKRKVGCHSNCQDYINSKKQYKKKDNEIEGYYREKYWKLRKIYPNK